MLRFSYILVTGLFLAILALYRLSNCAKNEDYTEDQRYAEAIRTVKLLKNRGRIHTEVFGEEYLPKENGYILYANHQGKYDALGILYGHSKPLSILMDYDKSKTVLVTQFIDTLRGIRLKMNDPKQQIKALNQLAKEVKEGRRYLIFPEGKYSDNRNRLQEFSSGCFRCAKKAA